MKFPHCGQLCTATVSSPIGNLSVTCCAHGVHAVALSANFTDLPDPRQVVQPLEGYGSDSLVMSECIDWLKSYFENNSNGPTARPRICPLENPTTFLQRTWKVLADRVHFGSTVSYGELAKMVDNPQAARAVGSAMSKNQVLLLVPCHRVILSTGKIGPFSQGKRNHIKKWLLEHEGILKAY